MHSSSSKPSLPVFGIGPVVAITTFGLTALVTFLWWTNLLASGKLSDPRWVYTLRFHAALLLVLGIFLWAGTLVLGRMVQNIRAGKLMTTGFYAWVRNPLYAGILLINCAVLLALANLWVMVLPFFYWAFITFLLKASEEKWLLAKFGAEYMAYAVRVNRILPWPPFLQRR